VNPLIPTFFSSLFVQFLIIFSILVFSTVFRPQTQRTFLSRLFGAYLLGPVPPLFIPPAGPLVRPLSADAQYR
jgi:hypothetical protein